jgi:hypothetical protein
MWYILMEVKMNDYTIVAPIENEIQAELLDAVLSERNIPYIIVSHHDSAFDGLFSAYHGWGCVKAPPEFHEEIKQIIETLKTEKNIPTPVPDPEKMTPEPDQPE